MKAPATFRAPLWLLLGAWFGAACQTPGGPSGPSHSAAASEALALLRGPTLSGDTLELPHDRSTLLVFWASWCESCRAEAPAIEALHERAGSELQVVGISVDEDAEQARAYQRAAALTFPSLNDPELRIADALDVSGTPTLVLLDENGRELARGHGLHESELAEALPSGESEPSASRAAAPTSQLHHTSELPTVSRSAVLMGTDIELLVLSADRERAETAIDVALEEMARIEDLMTDWTETSQVAAIGHAAGREPVAVDPELLDLLLAAREVSELTDGGFDVTWAGAAGLWDFRADPPSLPSEADIARAIERVDYRALELDEEAGTAFLRTPGMRVGLGAIAKGYAVDRAMGVLERAGFEDYAVNAGGDLAVHGRRGEDLWWVSIRDPRDPNGFIGVLPVSNLSVVTSGDYERFFELDGERYCHILDPATGWPARGTRSVTVMASRTWWADALATGVFVLGPERGLALLESLTGVEGLIVDAAGDLHVSSGLTAPLPPS